MGMCHKAIRSVRDSAAGKNEFVKKITNVISSFHRAANRALGTIPHSETTFLNVCGFDPG